MTMSPATRTRTTFADRCRPAALLAVLLGAGCGSDPAPAAPATAAPTKNAIAAGAKRLGNPMAGATDEEPGADPARRGPGADPDAGPSLAMNLVEGDFIETEGDRRDPFRAYAAQEATRPTAGPRVPVLLAEVPVDELRLIAIVSGVGTPRAMVVDSTHVGTIVRRGDYVGRGDVVRNASGEFMINWRVSKILTDGVVLVREDPTAPGRAPLTRMIGLHPEDQQGNNR